MNINLSIIVPSYNELNTIEEFTLNLKKTFINESVKFIFVKIFAAEVTLFLISQLIDCY